MKVAVLGGGVGAMVAAFELTRPEHEGRYEVTVYQPGWRLGGKGASGRNMKDGMGCRIEEHGLHVWFGFYENAFKVLRDAYAELAQVPPLETAKGDAWADASELRFRTIDDAFKGSDEVVLAEPQGSGWEQIGIQFPHHPGEPGTGIATRPNLWELVEQIASRQRLGSRQARWPVREAWRPTFWSSLVLAAARRRAHDPNGVDELAAAVGVRIRTHHRVTGQHLPLVAEGLARHRSGGGVVEGASDQELLCSVADLLCAFRDFVWELYAKRRVGRDARVRVAFTTLDAWATGARGIVDDRIPERGLDTLNGEDLCAWLSRHGANSITVGRTPYERCAMLRAMYDLTFAYPDGDIMRADGAAGAGIANILRLAFGYSGRYMYKMQAGMGDAVFAPLYCALRRRGVRFEFFNAVTRMGASRDGWIEEIDLVQQLEVDTDSRSYEPLVKVQGINCFPSEPNWSQLRGGTELLQRLGGDVSRLELEHDPLGGPTRTLRRSVPGGRGDFDQVVLGISPGGLDAICSELKAASPRFAEMLASTVTTPTQAFQLWLKKPTRKLGWRHGTNSAASTFVEPLDTYCDMSQLTCAENWDASQHVRSIAYFVGVLEKRDGETPAQATERVKRAAIEFMSHHIGVWWPKSVTKSGALRPELLVANGAEPFDEQYYRANTTGSELYVLFPSKLIDKRLPSDASGFHNLVLAGDWTRNGIDGGCVESAALSGRQAARGVTGVNERYYGEDDAWLRSVN